MSGLFRRISRARAASSEPEAPALSEPHAIKDAEPDHPDGGGPLPAGVELDAMIGERPTTRRRGRLRRRLRHLRGVRELLLRDLGGLVFEIHRAGAQTAGNTEGRVVGGKLHRLASVDAEIRELEEILDDRRPSVIREPGIGGTCAVCGELFGSDARFCWACGMPVAPGVARPTVVAGPVVALPQLAAPAVIHEPPPAKAEPETPPTQPIVEPFIDSDAAPMHSPVADPPPAPGRAEWAVREPPADEQPTERLTPEPPAAEPRTAAPEEEPPAAPVSPEPPATPREREQPSIWEPPARADAEAPPPVSPGDPLAAPAWKPEK